MDVRRCSCFIVAGLCLIFGYLTASVAAEDDLYKRIGIHRTATTQEIRKAYKKLARELHPDKNPDPDAHDRFTQINEAYEILTDAEKRKEYDNFGHVNVQQGGDRRQHFQGFHHQFNEFFGGFNFNFGSRNEATEKYRITHRMYKMTILPKSFEKIHIIYIYESMCLICMRLETIWERFTKDLEVIGVGIGSFNLDREGQLANQVKVHHAPAIIGVYNGKISYYRGDVGINELRKFVRSLFPKKLVTQVDDLNYVKFLDGWKDNRMRALFFSRQEVVPLRYLAASFRYKERVVTGFVRLGWSRTREMEAKFGINSQRESLLMFNEDFTTPVAIASMNKMSRNTMDEVFEANQYLQLPRLSSQEIFNQLCPIENRVSLRKLCVVLVSRNVIEHDVARSTFREMSKDSDRVRRNAQFVYIYEDSQTPFINALSKQRKTVAESELEVVILWRRGSRQMDYEWLEDGWSLTSENTYKHKTKLLRTLDDILYNNLPMKGTIGGWPELMDEHASSLLVRILNRIYDWFDGVYMLWRGVDELTLFYGMFTIICIVFFGIFMHKLVVMEDESIHGPQRRQQQQQQQQQQQAASVKKKEDNTLLIRELRDETFPQLIRDSPPGHMTICILVDQERKTKLLQKFAKICWTYSKYKAFTFSFLQLDYYLSWYRRLLEETLDFRRNLDHINVKNCIGTVLAINGHRKYFCMYHAKHPTKTRHVTKQAAGGAAGTGGKFMGFDDSSSEDEDRDMAIFEDDLLLGLREWFDCLCEGSLRRMRVDKWPDTCPS